MKKFIAIMILIFAAQIHAQTFSVSGGDLDSVSIGDTLVAEIDSGNIVVRIENNTEMLVKAGSVIIFIGGENLLRIALIDGQIFINRKGEQEFDTLSVSAQEYVFAPAVQTVAFAAKATPQGSPTVAVLRGVVHMFADGATNLSDDDIVVVEEFRFGTVNSNGIPVSGDLNERGISQLEAWTGLTRAAQNESEEAATVTVYVEVDDDEDESRPLTKRELRRMRKEERRLAKEARREERRAAKEARRQERGNQEK